MRPAPPGSLEDVRQHEHRHVATNAVTLAGYLHQLRGHRVLRLWIAVVELQRVRPARKVRVAAVSQHAILSLARHPGVVLRFALQIGDGAGNVVVRMALNPGMIETGVIRHEIEHQPKAARPEAIAQPRQCGVTAQAFVGRVAGDGKPGPRDVVFAKIGQRVLELAPPIRMAARHALAGGPRLPYAQHPDPIESQRREPVQVAVGNVVQCGRAAEVTGKLCQEDPGVDLEQRGILHAKNDIKP